MAGIRWRHRASAVGQDKLIRHRSPRPYIDPIVVEALKARMARTVAGTLEVNATELAALPRALSRRLIREVLAEVKGNLRGLAFGHVERVLELAACQAGEPPACEHSGPRCHPWQRR